MRFDFGVFVDVFALDILVIWGCTSFRAYPAGLAKAYRGFESLSLRHVIKLTYYFITFFGITLSNRPPICPPFLVGLGGISVAFAGIEDALSGIVSRFAPCSMLGADLEAHTGKRKPTRI